MYLVDGNKRLLAGTCGRCKRYHRVPIGALCTYVPTPRPTFAGPGLDGGSGVMVRVAKIEPRGFTLVDFAALAVAGEDRT